MTAPVYIPLTVESARDLLAQVDRVPKNRQFAYRNLTIDEKGRGVVVVMTNAAPESIMRWFSEAGGMVTRIERNPKETGYICWFDWK